MLRSSIAASSAVLRHVASAAGMSSLPRTAAPTLAMSWRMLSSSADNQQQQNSDQKKSEQESKLEQQQQQQEQKKPEEKSVRETELEKELTDARAKIKELTDGYLRAIADMENVREQKRKEVESARQFALQKFAKDVVEIPEVLTLALESVPEPMRASTEHPVLADFYKGVNMMREELMKVLRRHGVNEIATVGNKFDPNLHEAIFEMPDASKAPGTVSACIKQGFTLNGRTIRAAQVGVTKKP